MKSKIQSIIKSVVFLIVFCVGLACIYNILKWKDTNGDYLSTFDSLYSLEKDEVDVVFAGPSYTYQTMNPAQFWEDYGISAFTMSISGQDKNSTVASIREVLKTQSPDVVMIDVSGTLFDEHAIQGNVYRNTISMKLSANSINLVNKSIAAEDRMDYWLRWPIIHTRYKELKRYDFVQYKPSIYSMGFNYMFNVYGREFSQDVFTVKDSFEISEKNKAWIDELYAMSQEKGFELVFYLTPGVADGDGRRTINGVADYLKELDITFIDLDKTELVQKIDYSKDFADYRHLNYYGSVKQVKYIAEYLQENYGIADHRGDEGYEAWDSAVRYKTAVLTENGELANGDPVEVARNMMQLDDVVIVVSVEGNYNQAESNIADTLEILGLTIQNEQLGETWVIEDGIVTYDSSESGIYRTKVNGADTMEVYRVTGGWDKYVARIFIGNDCKRGDIYNIDGMYMFVYDKVTDKCIINGYFY